MARAATTAGGGGKSGPRSSSGEEESDYARASARGRRKASWGSTACRTIDVAVVNRPMPEAFPRMLHKGAVAADDRDGRHADAHHEVQPGPATPRS